MKGEPMRLFIAINFSADTRSRLLALRDELRCKSRSGNFSAPENLHLTLVFLGECDARQADIVKQILGASIFAPFEISFDQVGRFRRDGGDLWWVGLCESKPLSALQRGLSDKLNAAGFVIDHRKYTPHITLGREIVTDANPWEIEPFVETVGTIELMRSERIAGKLTYTEMR